MTRVIMVLICFAAAVADASAQPYPTRPIRVISGSSPGSPSDLVMRAVAQELSPRLGQPIVVENRVGGNTVIAHDACAKSAPDGHTICVITSDGMSYAPFVVDKLPYDVDKDFKPVTLLYQLMDSLIAHPSLTVHTVDELHRLAVKKSGMLNFGTMGPGSEMDTFRMWLSDHWKTDLVGVHYKSSNFVFTAIIAGEIQLSKGSLGNTVGMAQGGKVVLLAVNTSKRLANLPNVPTFEESGFHGAPGRSFWGTAVAAGTPDSIVKRLNAELVRLFHEPKMADFLEKRYLDMAVGTPEQFAAFLQSDREEIGGLLKKFKAGR